MRAVTTATNFGFFRTIRVKFRMPFQSAKGLHRSTPRVSLGSEAARRCCASVRPR